MFMYHGIDTGMNQENGPDLKKVLFVVTKSNFGGAQRYVFDIATSLPKDRFEAVVVAGSAQGTSAAGELFTRLAHAGIRTIYLPEMQRDMSILDVRVFAALWRVMRRERPDAVHLNSSKAGGLGALAARLALVPRIIFTAHGWAFREARNPLSRLLIYKASLFTAFLCHRVICLSHYDMRAFSRLPFVGKKMVLVQSGIRGAGMALTREQARKELGGGWQNAIWIGSIGELTYNKNIRTALDALALARKSDDRLYYVVIGDGEQRDQLRRYAERKEIDRYVHFAGSIKDAARLMPAFDIFLLPSRKEGLPYVLLEAAHARIPVVASTVGGIPELIENGVSGALCEPSDTMGIADCLVELAADSALRERFSNALYERAVSDYSISRMIERTATLYLART
jgi:glycosyltransferase involved in cell wall biosynthesis